MRDLEAEKAIVGALLVQPEFVEDLPGQLSVDDFTGRGLGELAVELVSMAERGDAIDIATVLARMGDRAPLFGGLAALGELSARWTHRAAFVAHVRRVRRLADVRRLVEACGEIRDDARNVPDPDAFLDRAAVRLGQLTEGTARGRSLQLVRERTGDVLQRLFNGKAAGIPTGLDGYDRLTTGCGRGELVIIAGRPSHGKSVLGVELALGMGVLTYVAQLEMSDDQMITRMLCREAKLDMTRVRAGRVSERDKADLVTASARVDAYPITIDDRPDLTIQRIRAEARAFFRQHRRKRLDGSLEDVCVVIDYGQLVGVDERSGSREQDVSEVSRGAKKLARELHCPVLLLAQLNRKVDERPIPRPTISDLRESGSLEQDADTIAFIWRPERYDRTDKPDVRGKAEVIIGKQRMGPIGAFWVAFDGQFATIRNFQEHEKA